MHITLLASRYLRDLQACCSQQLASESTTTLKQLSRWYLAITGQVKPLIAPQTDAIAPLAR